MHSSRMRTARSLPYDGGGLCPGRVSLTETPGQRPPRTETTPGQRPCPSRQRLQKPLVHAGTEIPLWTEFLTHACENITLSQLRCGR